MSTDDPEATAFRRARRNLPHACEANAGYMVTWRLRQELSPLTGPERQLVCEVLNHFDSERYRLGAYVVMDDHVHVIAQPSADWSLSSILHSWKSYSANRLQRFHGRSGSVWQDESYDRVLRDARDLEEKSRYILANPMRRWPGTVDYPHMGWGSLHR